MINYDLLPRRDVLCIDMKSFFASVESVRRGIDPLDSYIVVVSDFDRKGAVVLASSPRVKKEFNIKTGNRKYEIPRNKKIMLVEPSMDLYIDINHKINEIFSRYAAPQDIFPYSIDESFIDISPSLGCLQKSPRDIAIEIQNVIKEELGLVATVGIGDNPLLSKLALDNGAKKIRGDLAYWSYKSIPYTLWKLPRLTDMWGLGKGYEKRFKEVGINSIYELAHSNKKILEKLFGKVGVQYYYHANGVDNRIISEIERVKDKSFSKGQVLFEDYNDIEKIKIIVLETMEVLASKLRRKKYLAGEIMLNLGYSYRCNIPATNVHRKIDYPSNTTQVLQEKIVKLLYEVRKEYPVRQIAVGVGRISREDSDNFHQISFFEKDYSNYKKVDQAMDKIREKYGYTKIVRGYSMLEGSTLIERERKKRGHKAMSDSRSIRFQ